MHLRPRIWVAIIAAGWLVMVAPVAVPASFWFKVDRVYVHDAVDGSTPLMEVDRTIVRPFHGRWIATVLRKNHRGTYATFCTAVGANDYRPGNMLPDMVDLNWWTWPTRCTLPPGTYFLNTLWTIDAPFFPDKEVRISSNAFEITPD
ncbi:MAG: hypothetical protein AB7P12_16180 [Alphaproteobacteria bacterium]